MSDGPLERPELAPEPQPATDSDVSFKYAAFISYRRVDGSQIAERLRYKLLEYQLPSAFPTRPLKIYLDRIYERATEDFFRDTVEPSLRASRALIVVQTPKAAIALEDGSDNWVAREVRLFRSLPQGKNVWVALGSGEFSDPLPADLSRDLPNVERVDVRALSGRLGLVSEHELLKFIGPLHDIPAELMPNLRRDVERRTRWRAVRWALVATLIIAALVGLSVVAVRQTTVANAERLASDKSRQLAEERATIAESRRLATMAASQLSTNPEASLELAVQSFTVAPTEDAINVLRDALPRSRLRFRVPEGNGAMSDDGKSVATKAPYQPLVSVWDVASGRKRFSVDSKSVDRVEMAFTPDGRLLIVGNGAMSIPFVTFDATSGEKRRSFDASRLPPQLSHDSRLLLTADFEHRVHVWNLDTGERLATLPAQSAPITDFSFSPDDTLILTAGEDGTAKVWDAANKRPLRTLKHAAKLWSARFDPSGERIVTASGDVARIWDWRTGRMAGSFLGLLGRDNVVFEAELSGLNPLLGPLVIREAGRCSVWAPTLVDLLDRDLKPTIDLTIDNPDNDTFCKASPDGDLMATPDAIWDLHTKERLTTFTHGDGGEGVGAARFSRDGKVVAVTRRSETEVWAVGPESPILTLPVPGAQILAGGVGLTAAVSRDGSRGAFAAREGQLSLWDLKTGEKLWDALADEEYAWDVAFSPDGSQLLTGGNSGKAVLWNARHGFRLREFVRSRDALKHVAFVPGHNEIMTLGIDNRATLWDASTGAPLRQFDKANGPIYSYAINPGGTQAVFGDDNTIHVWDFDSGESRLLAAPSPIVSDLIFSRSGRYMASLSGRGQGKLALVVWDAATGLEITRVEAYRVYAFFDPDESVLATDVGLINWRSGKHITKLDSPGEPVWSANQRCVLTKGRTGMQLRDSLSGRVYVTFRIFPDSFPGGFFSNDGSFLLASDSASVRLFSSESCLSVADLIATAKLRPRPS